QARLLSKIAFGLCKIQATARSPPTSPASSRRCRFYSRFNRVVSEDTAEVLLGESSDTEAQISDLEELPVRVAYFQSILKIQHHSDMEGGSSIPDPMSESREAMSTDQSSRSSKRRAKVWGYVDSEQVDGIEKAVCKFCKIQLSSVAGKGTTHLNRHIQFHCPSIPQEERDRFISTLKTKSTDGDMHVFDPVVFRGLIAKYFINAEIAFRKAEDPCWKEMINYCQPSFRVVGRLSVRADCMMLYEEEKLMLIDQFTKLRSHV
ncbi:unnamed protein product, partial [Urochloa humidicola]